VRDPILYQKEAEKRKNKSESSADLKNSVSHEKLLNGGVPPSSTEMAVQPVEGVVTTLKEVSPSALTPHSTLASAEIISSIEEIPPYDQIAIDTETTGLERDATGGFVTADNHQLLGVSFCGEVGKAFWLPADKIVPFVMEATLAGKQLIMHNAKFDLQVLARNGISLYGNQIFDTMIAHQLLDENEGHGLKHLAKTILGAEVKMEQRPYIESP